MLQNGLDGQRNRYMYYSFHLKNKITSLQCKEVLKHDLHSMTCCKIAIFTYQSEKIDIILYLTSAELDIQNVGKYGEVENKKYN